MVSARVSSIGGSPYTTPEELVRLVLCSVARYPMRRCFSAGAFAVAAVVVATAEAAEDQLKQLAEKNGIKKTVLTKDNVAGPPGYKIAKDADVTVILYNKRSVEVNHAYRKGEFNSKAVESVVGELSKITK